MKRALFVFLYLCLVSCNDDKNHSNYRNQDHIWHFDNESSKGEWIKIDKYGKGPRIENGHCTAFYQNGNIREEYEISKSGKTVTVYFFDLEENLTHHSFTKKDSIQNFIYKDGTNGTTLTGSSKVNKITKNNG